MKLLLISLLLAGLPPWVSKVTACPEHEDKAEATKVVISAGDGVKAIAVPCSTKGKTKAPCVVASPGVGQYIVSASGDGPAVYTTADGDAVRAYAYAVGGPKDGRSEDRVVWVGSHGDAKDRAWLGVSIGEVPEALASQLDIEGQGILVLNVVEDSPADEAGLRVHDIILAVDDEDVDGNSGQAVSLIKSHKPGDEVELVILRDGRERVLSVELGSRADAKGLELDFKFDRGPLAELEEKVRTRARILKRGEGDEWVVEDLGDIEKLHNLPHKIKMFMPKSGSRSTQVYVHGDERKVTTKVERDGSTIAIAQEGDGPIVVTRVDEDGRETEAEYGSEEELAEADEEAYELWENIGDNVVVHMDLDEIELPDIEIPELNIEIPEFRFHFDADEWKEHADEWKAHMEEWGEEYGEKMREWGEEYGQKWQEWAEEFGAQFEGLENGQLPEGFEFPAMPLFLDKDGHGEFPGLMHLRHLRRPEHTFEVNTDGSIEVRIRRGESELVQVFEDEDDLADRRPKLYKKYERMMGLENE